MCAITTRPPSPSSTNCFTFKLGRKKLKCAKIGGKEDNLERENGMNWRDRTIKVGKREKIEIRKRGKKKLERQKKKN